MKDLVSSLSSPWSVTGMSLTEQQMYSAMVKTLASWGNLVCHPPQLMQTTQPLHFPHGAAAATPVAMCFSQKVQNLSSSASVNF